MKKIKIYADQQLGGSKNTLLLISVGILYALVAFRMMYSGKLYYLFLIWNTFLAVVPYAISEYTTRFKNNKYKAILLCSLSILFLPNALYLISDFEHLAERPPVPFFFDILLMFYAAMLGLLFNVLSIRNLHTVSLHYLLPKTSNKLMAFIIVLSGFGVYLGRYLRWNSWDIVTHPKTLLMDCIYHSIHPNLFGYTWAVSIGYAFVLGFGYLLFRQTELLIKQDLFK